MAHLALLDGVLTQLGEELPETVAALRRPLSEEADGLSQLAKVLLDLGVVRGHVHHPDTLPPLELGQHLVVGLVQDGGGGLQRQVLRGNLDIVGVFGTCG